MSYAKLILLLIILSIVLNTGYSQTEKKHEYNNTIMLTSCAFFIKNKHEHLWPFAQIGLAYEKKIKNNWRLGISYSQWENFSGVRPYILEHGTIFVSVVDEIVIRAAYKMLDLYINYHLAIAPKHYVYTGVAISCNWGKNEYVEWYSTGPPPYMDTQMSFYQKEVSYLGAIFMVGYDYWCYHNRVNIGFDYRLRSYIGRPENQHDIGFHIGYNF